MDQEYTIKKDVGFGFWMSPKNEVYGLDYHTYISQLDPEFEKIWEDNTTNNFMQKMMEMGWIRFRVYNFGLHINGDGLMKPHRRAQVRRILLYALDHHCDRGVTEDTKVVLVGKDQGCYGSRCEPDYQFTVGQLLGRR